MPGKAYIQYLGDYFAGSPHFLYFLADTRARCIYANDLFLKHFGVAGNGESFISLFEDKEFYRQLAGQCMEKRGEVMRAGLLMKLPGGLTRRVDWELSACKQGNDEEIYIQAAGIMTNEEGSGIAKAGKQIGSLPERYKAYEQSREGLWRFDSDVPVSIDAEPDDIIKYWRKHSCLVECNENMARMYGYEKAEELIGTRLEQLMDFSDEQRVSNLRKFIQNGFRSTIVETREFDRHGNVKYFLNSMEGIINKGKLTTVWGTQQDITDQRLAEERIRYLALLVGNVSDIIISYDTDLNVVSWNKAAAEILGYTEEEMKGKKVGDVISVETIGTTRSQLLAILQETGEWKGESRLVSKHGKTVTLLTTSTRIFDDAGNLEGYVTVSKDITEKRIAEEQLKASEQFYRNLIAESLDGIVLTDEKGVIQFAAPSGTKILGHQPEVVTGKTIFDFVHPEDRAKAVESFEREIAVLSREQFISVRLLRSDGQWVWCLVRAHNMFNNPNVGGLVIYYYDDTLRRKMLEELRIQAITLSHVFDLIITCDFDYNILSWNKRAEQVIGYTGEEVAGKFLGDVARLDYGSFTADQVAAILAEKGYWQGEISFRDKAGNRKTVLHTASYLLNEDGERIAIIGTGIDITEKKNAEEQLKQSELFYRNLFVNSLDVVLITDPSSKIKFASPSVTAILGYSPEEIVGATTFDFAHPDDRHIAEAAFAEELTGTPQQKYISVRIKNGQGEWVWCIVRGHNLLENPYINGMVVYLYDDRLRKQTEQALIESENRFRTQATLLNNVTDVIVTTDMNRVVTSWNRVCEKLTGILSSRAVGRMYRDVMETSYHPFSNDQVFEIVRKEGIWRGEISFRGFEGETKYLLHTISLLQNEKGESTGMMGVGKDITERKKIESQLQQSESFYRALAANSLDGIILTDETAKIIHCGPSVFHISGYELDQMLGKNIFDFVHPDDSALALQAFAVEVKSESVLNYIVIRLRHATRGWVWCTVRGHNLLHDPVLKAIVIYFTDDTKRKQIEDRLRESESRFRKMIHTLKLGVILQNERSEMLVCNQAALDMLGITEEQLLGKTSFDPHWNVTHEDGTDFPAAVHPAPMAITTKKPVRDVVMGVFRPGRNDRVWLLVNAEPVFDDEKNIINVISSFTDITEQRRISQQLVEQEVQRQRLITQATIDGQEKERQEIGKELHDNINQHLTTTRLYLEVAREKAADEVLEMINLAHKNLADIVNEIRMLSQSLVPPTLGDLGLVESVQDLCDSLRRTHSFKIEFYHRQFSENGLPENMKLMIFRIIQEQVNNIIRHAQAKTISIRLQTDAENITFSIADDGQGFDSQRLKKGMGFSNISNRAGLFHGKVDINATPGQGCTVTVTLPLPGIRRD